MKKLFLTLFVFLFLGAFANSKNHEKSTDFNDSNDDVTVMFYQKADCSKGIYQDYRHYLGEQNSQGYIGYSTPGGYDQANVAQIEPKEGYNYYPEKQSSEVKGRNNQRSTYSHVHLRFAQDYGKAIRNDNKDTSLKVGEKASTRYHKRAQRMATHILQHRPDSYATAFRSRDMETHFKKI